MGRAFDYAQQLQPLQVEKVNQETQTDDAAPPGVDSNT